MYGLREKKYPSRKIIPPDLLKHISKLGNKGETFDITTAPLSFCYTTSITIFSWPQHPKLKWILIKATRMQQLMKESSVELMLPKPVQFENFSPPAIWSILKCAIASVSFQWRSVGCSKKLQEGEHAIFISLRGRTSSYYIPNVWRLYIAKLILWDFFWRRCKQIMQSAV